MENEVKVIYKHDDSVNKAIEKTAKRLATKYNKKRDINLKALEKRSRIPKWLSIILTTLLGVVIVFCGMLCYSIINARLKRVVPQFGGISTMRIVSGSMVKSGFKIGDTVVVKKVNQNSLKPDDIIAFYTYSPSYYGVNANDFSKVEQFENRNYKITFSEFFGVTSPEIINAGRVGAMLTFHHIREVFEDSDGTRWFKTYGSSNPGDDTWIINENYVVGIYDNSGMGKILAFVLNFASSTVGLFACILVPIVIVSILLVKQCLHDVQVAKLELDVVEEKRKLTDEICVKNGIGFGMDKKTKYKVLAQAGPDEINTYLALLYKNGSAPENIRKYYLRKRLILKNTQLRRDVHRKCEEMFKQGVKPTLIAEFYETENKKIMEKFEKDQKRLKTLINKYKNMIKLQNSESEKSEDKKQN